MSKPNFIPHNHPVIQQARELLTKSGREIGNYSLVAAEGLEALEWAVQFKCLQTIITLKSILKVIKFSVREYKCNVFITDHKCFRQLSKNKENCIIILRNSYKPLIGNCIVLENLEKHSNLGDIVRNSYCLGISSFILISEKIDWWHRKTIEYSRGLVLGAVGLYMYRTLSDFYSAFPNSYVISFITSATIPIKNFPIEKKRQYFLAFGNEYTGLSKTFISSSTILLNIPMIDEANSLSVSSCTSIVASYFFL